MNDERSALFRAANEEGTEYVFAVLDAERCAILRDGRIVHVANVGAPGAVNDAVDLYRKLIGHGPGCGRTRLAYRWHTPDALGEHFFTSPGGA